MKTNLLKTFFVALCLFSATFATAHDFEVDGIYYNITDATAKIVEVTYKGDYYYSYPNEYTGTVSLSTTVIYKGITYRATSIGNYAFYKCTGLTSITIPNSITAIKSSAFRDCTSLISVIIPNSVTSIEECAFSSCTSLTSVTIPNSVTTIGSSAFYECTGLNTVYNLSNLTFSTGSSSYGYVAYYADKVVNAPNGSIEGDFVFGVIDGVNTLCGYIGNGGEIALPANYKGESYAIGNSAFSGCKGLTSVTIPNSVTTIGNYAFSGCTGLTSVTIPNSVTTIGNSAFSGCKGLTSVTIPNSVTTIGNYAFSGCTGLASVIIGSGVTSIGYCAFYNCNGLTSVTIGNSVTSIRSDAFGYCNGLTSVTIGNSVTSIRSDAFGYCNGLNAVYINDLAAWCKIDFASYNSNPLYYAKNLYLNGEIVTNLVIPSNVTEIKSDAFYNCHSLTSVTIPNSVTTIGNNAFYNCRSLNAVYINDLAAWCKIDFASYNSNPLYYAKNLYLKGEKVTNLVVPDDVTEIKQYAFYNCSGLTSVTIPNSVTTIGSSAFYDCKNLKTVYNFSNLTFSKGSSDYGYVAYYANKVINAPGCNIFEGDFICGVIDGVNTLYEYIGNGGDVTLPASYKGKSYVIGNNAFSGCTSLTSITIPNSVTAIESNAFYNCGIKKSFG